MMGWFGNFSFPASLFLLKRNYNNRKEVVAMDGQPEKRMADSYEITQSMWIGDKEVVLGVDMTNSMPYFCAFYTSNEIFDSYDGCMVSDDYVEMVELFAERVSGQCQKVREEQEKITVPKEPVTADMCQTVDYDTNMVGKVIAIRADALRPEYRMAPYQLVYVTGGNGAMANAIGRACFCRNLYNGEKNKCVRSNFYGEVKMEHLPDWAKERLEKMRKKEQDREVR